MLQTGLKFSEKNYAFKFWAGKSSRGAQHQGLAEFLSELRVFIGCGPSGWRLPFLKPTASSPQKKRRRSPKHQFFQGELFVLREVSCDTCLRSDENTVQHNESSMWMIWPCTLGCCKAHRSWKKILDKQTPLDKHFVLSSILCVQITVLSTNGFFPKLCTSHLGVLATHHRIRTTPGPIQMFLGNTGPVPMTTWVVRSKFSQAKMKKRNGKRVACQVWNRGLGWDEMTLEMVSITLLGTKISPLKGTFEDDVLLPRWDIF